MKKILYLLMAVCLLPFYSQAQLSDKFADTLQSFLNARCKSYKLKSVAAAIVFPDGSVWNGAYGNCGTEMTTPDMLFEMGSNTKTFTATMILQMADEGKLNLNDTLYKFLPVHPNIAYGITLRQMLNHTSGIYSYTDHPGFSDFVNGDPEAIVSVDTIIKKWIGPMRFKPGSKWEYSNSNYLLLGRIIEKIDGMPYEQALRKRILDKFNFKETYLDVYESYTREKAGNWLSDGSYFGEDFKSFMSAAWAAGAILATPRDLAKWAEELYHGDILPGHWLDSMRVTVPVGSGYSYGLGMFERKFLNKTFLGHGGTTLQNSEMDYSLSRNYSVVTVVNEQDKGNEAHYIQNGLITIMENLLPKYVGIAEQHKPVNFTYYPNPASANLSISFNPELLAEHPLSVLNIYSVSGALEKSVKLNDPDFQIEVGNLSRGLHLLRINDAEGNILSVNKLILQ